MCGFSSWGEWSWVVLFGGAWFFMLGIVVILVLEVDSVGFCQSVWYRSGELVSIY